MGLEITPKVPPSPGYFRSCPASVISLCSPLENRNHPSFLNRVYRIGERRERKLILISFNESWYIILKVCLGFEEQGMKFLLRKVKQCLMAIKAPEQTAPQPAVGKKAKGGFGEQMESSNKWETECLGALEITAFLSFIIRWSHNLKIVKTFLYPFKLKALRWRHFYDILN